MSTSSSSDLSDFLPIIYGFLGAIAAFIIFVPFYRSRKSFFDAIAARRIVSFLRFAIFCEIFIILPLLYFTIDYGYPVSYPYNSLALTYGTKNSNSWVFGYGRPITGIITIGFGFFADMHIGPRVTCLFGSALQAVLDAFSYLQVNDYIIQTKHYSAPLGKYTSSTLAFYELRDVISFSCCIWTFLLCGHLCNVVGWCQPPYISYSTIVGGPLDRCEVMRKQSTLKKRYAHQKNFSNHSSANDENDFLIVDDNNVKGSFREGSKSSLANRREDSVQQQSSRDALNPPLQTPGAMDPETPPPPLDSTKEDNTRIMMI